LRAPAAHNPVRNDGKCYLSAPKVLYFYSFKLDYEIYDDLNFHKKEHDAAVVYFYFSEFGGVANLAPLKSSRRGVSLPRC
jgi:hypothetical protein